MPNWRSSRPIARGTYCTCTWCAVPCSLVISIVESARAFFRAEFHSVPFLPALARSLVRRRGGATACHCARSTRHDLTLHYTLFFNTENEQQLSLTTRVREAQSTITSSGARYRYQHDTVSYSGLIFSSADRAVSGGLEEISLFTCNPVNCKMQ